MSKVSIDIGEDVVSIALAGWPAELRKEIDACFLGQGDVLDIDLSHLPDPDGWRVGRSDFLFKVKEAAEQGVLALFATILGQEASRLDGSSSVRDGERLRGVGSMLQADFLPLSDGDLRDLVIAEISPDANWTGWALNGSNRAGFLADEAVVSALFSRIDGADAYRSVFDWLVPTADEDGLVFERLIAEHWPETRNLFAEEVAKFVLFGNRARSLLEHSTKAQGSASIRKRIVRSADDSQLAILIPLCRTLEAADVRVLFERLRVERGKAASDHAVAPGLVAALVSLQRLKRSSLPSDLVLSALWHELELPDFQPAPGHAAVIERLRELPEVPGARLVWDQLGPEARNAWRQDLFDVAAADPEFALGVIHFACRWLDRRAFTEVEPVLRRLIGDADMVAGVSELTKEEPRQVALRAMALVGARSEPYGIEGRTEEASSLPSVGARTWLGDPSVEQVIRRKVGEAEARFSNAYPRRWGLEEEMLATRFLGEVVRATEEIVEQFHELSRAARRRFPHLSVEFRQTSKREEGASTSAGAPLATDVLFLTRILDRDKTPIERATLVQVKKRVASEATGRFGGTVTVDLQQCKDLITQTEHAFYLVLTPPDPEATLWVTPARLMGNLAELHDSRSSVSALQARDASISFADFFLTHLVGLWAGDEAEDLVAIAKGDAGRGKIPELIVEIVVRREGG